MIFSFSLQPADDSSQISSGFVAWIIDNVLSIFSADTMSAEQLSLFHTLIRKCAHFTEFFILGVFMCLTISQTKGRYKFIVAVILCMLVAATDETIQLFVDGRAGRIMDVMIDSCGGLAGIWITKKVTALFK